MLAGASFSAGPPSQVTFRVTKPRAPSRSLNASALSADTIETDRRTAIQRLQPGCGPGVTEHPRAQISRLPAGSHCNPVEQLPDVHEHGFCPAGEGRKQQPAPAIEARAEDIVPEDLRQVGGTWAQPANASVCLEPPMCVRPCETVWRATAGGSEGNAFQPPLSMSEPAKSATARDRDSAPIL
jgi:hypothetical protein